MRQTSDQLCFDLHRRHASLNGTRLLLQDKAFRVLVLLARRAPAAVSRSKIIASVWQGNHLTGEKGLNQALWAIRTALCDDARNPRFVQTLPRVGYRWLRCPLVEKQPLWDRTAFRAIAAALVTLAIVAPTAPTSDSKLYSLPAQCEPSSQADVQAYRVNRELFIDFQDGCRLIVKSSVGKHFGEPLVSTDGQSVAFTVTEEQSCRLITLALQDGQRNDFGECPA